MLISKDKEEIEEKNYEIMILEKISTVNNTTSNTDSFSTMPATPSILKPPIRAASGKPNSHHNAYNYKISKSASAGDMPSRLKNGMLSKHSSNVMLNKHGGSSNVMFNIHGVSTNRMLNSKRVISQSRSVTSMIHLQDINHVISSRTPPKPPTFQDVFKNKNSNVNKSVPFRHQEAIETITQHLQDHSRELHNLVEDKDIAARAVAFVVNSTRKGIVPLCADVASLLRTKRRLENKVQRLRHDNEVLRSSLSASTRTSQSTSPVPNSLHSCDNRPHCRCSQSLCSDCSSQCSSLVGNSPGLDARLSCSHVTSAFTAPGIYQTQCLEPDHHHPTSETHRHRRGSHRKNSLPEITSQPGDDAVQVMPLPSVSSTNSTNSVSIETQCNLHNSAMLEVQFKESLQANSKLAEQLGAAKKEIELLKGKLKELEMNQLAKEAQEKFQVVNECSLPLSTAIENQFALYRVDGTKSSHNITQQYDSATYNTGTVKKKSISPVTIGSPLEGCICSNCTDIKLAGHCDRVQDRSTLETSFIKQKLPLEVGSHIVMKGDRTGYVRYLGHLDGVGQHKVVFAGIQLDAPVGRHDGILNGRRYFTCPKDCGIFVPLHEVVCVIPDQVSDVTEPKRASSFRLQRCASSDIDYKHHQHDSPPFQRRASDMDLRSKVRSGMMSATSSNGSQKKEQKEKMFLGRDTKDLKLPNDLKLTEGHLV